ncbi:MAG: hypothetical protein GEU98_03240 [Pseudonocardiaceae bacterium]|nr:hypothetical protein [Pseudonocardiaceae bacterium]
MRIFRQTPGRPRTAPGVAVAGVVALALTGCGTGSGSGDGGEAADCSDGPAKEITIAHQPGLGYAPLLIAKQQKTLEKRFPDTEITWRELDSGAAIRDGMIAGDIQVGSGGIAPFLVGYDTEVGWKIVTGLEKMNLQLMTKDPSIKSLKDLRGKGKIAMPGPDSIQSVVLRKAAEEQLGDAKALDSQIVAMGHPDGRQALASGQLAAHLTSPPFQGQEKADGARSIANSYDVFGEHTFNSAFTMSSFEACNSQFVSALAGAVTESNRLINNKPAEAAKLLSEEFADEPAKEIEKDLTADDVEFDTTPVGFGTFAGFMKEIGLIREVPESSDLFFDNKNTAGGN